MCERRLIDECFDVGFRTGRVLKRARCPLRPSSCRADRCRGERHAGHPPGMPRERAPRHIFSAPQGPMVLHVAGLRGRWGVWGAGALTKVCGARVDAELAPRGVDHGAN